MKQLLDDPNSILPIISLVLFVGMFCAVIVYIITDKRQDHKQRMEHMALDEDVQAAKEQSHG